MTLGIDSHGELTFTTNESIVPVGTIRGLIIYVIDNGTTTDNVTGVTVNGVAMTELAGSPYSPVITERAVIHGFFMGSGIPSGTLDIDFSGSIVQELTFYVAFTADGDTEVLDTSVASSGGSTNPSVGVTGDSAGVFAVGAIQHNVGASSSLSPGSGYTEITEQDFGVQLGGGERSTSLDTTTPTVSVAWISGVADDWMVHAVSVRESSAVVITLAAIGTATATGEAHRGAAASVSAIGSLAATGDASFGDTRTGTAAISAIGALSLSSHKAAVGALSISAVGSGVATATKHVQVAITLSALGRLLIPVIFTNFNRIVAPGKSGRIFHEIVLAGDTYHPNIHAWQAEEEAPGGMGPATGRISERVYRAHRELFTAGASWYTFLEDGTCVHMGRMLEPDTSQGEIQLSDRGVSSLTEREVGPILYQAHVGSEISRYASDSDQWRVEVTTMSSSFEDTAIRFKRSKDEDEGDAHIFIPFLGRELAYLRMHVQGQEGFISVQTTQRIRVPSLSSSAELDVSGSQYENWYFNFEASTSSGNAEIDLFLASGALSSPNTTLFTNEGDIGDTGWGFAYPDLIAIEVSDWASTDPDSEDEIILSNIEINGVALGEKRAFSAHDLVADIAALIGIQYTQIEGGAFDITPYELPPGVPASDALDYASLLSGKRWRILHNGQRPVLEFGSYEEHKWGLSSPWSPFDAIPQDRYDAVAVPYQYPGTHGQLTDQIVVRLKDSPLDRRNVFRELQLDLPAHNQDRATALGGRLLEELVRKRNAGSFAAAEVFGEDGLPTSAHHINAGDVLFPLREDEPGRLHIGRLTRYDDHVEGEFDGENRALARRLARRELRHSRR